MKINESVENYLETIYILNNRITKVKSIDIAKELDFSKASVSVAMKNLRTNNLIYVDSDGYITLSDSGLEIAKRMLERHTVLSECLTILGVNPKVAAADACRIEHVISSESFEALKRHVSSKISKIESK